MALTSYEQWQHIDEEARQRARDVGGNDSWYWSPTWQAMTSITDGVTTVHDVADALARGDGSPAIARLVADYWLMVGERVQADAATAVGEAAWAAVCDTTPDADGRYPPPSPAAAARIDTAENNLTAVAAIVEDLQQAAHQAWAAEADALLRQSRNPEDVADDHGLRAGAAATFYREDGSFDSLAYWSARATSSDPDVAAHAAATAATIREIRAANEPTPATSAGLTAEAREQARHAHDAAAGPSADDVLADLLDDLDQARAQLESGDARGDDKHELAVRIEHLEDRAAAQRQRAAHASSGDRCDNHQQASRDLATAQILHEALYADGPPVPADQAAEFAAYAEMWAQQAHAEFDRDLEERTETDQSADGETHGYGSEPADSCTQCHDEQAATYTVEVSGPAGHATYSVSATSDFRAERDARLRYYDDRGVSASDSNYVQAWGQLESGDARADDKPELARRTEANQSADGDSHGCLGQDAGGGHSEQPRAAEAVAAVHDAVRANTHPADQAPPSAQTHPARGVVADQQSAVGQGGDGHE